MIPASRNHLVLSTLLIMALTLPSAYAYAEGAGKRMGIFHFLRERAASDKADSANDAAKADTTPAENHLKDEFSKRDMLLYVPTHMPPSGQRAMVVALHGGGGSANFMQDHLHMNEVAEKYGFIVAYLNGTDAGPFLPAKMKAWNGGGCCGKPAKDSVDDIGYITGAVHYLTQKYGVDASRVFGMGHSNGGIMTQMIMCDSNLYQTGVAISGPLMNSASVCPAMRGRTMYAIHGADDVNVPVAGGYGTKGVTDVLFPSEAATKEIYERSGASYNLTLVMGADHKLEHLDDAIRQSEGISLAEKAARIFGLNQNAPIP